MDRNFAIFPPRVWPLPQSGTAYAPVGCQLPRRCNFVSRVILRLAWYRGTRSFRLIKSFIIRCVPSHISFPCESETNQCAFFMNMLPTWCTLPPTVKRRQIDNLSSEYVGVFPPFFVPCTITDISVDLTSFRHDRGGEWSLKSSPFFALCESYPCEDISMESNSIFKLPRSKIPARLVCFLRAESLSSQSSFYRTRYK